MNDVSRMKLHKLYRKLQNGGSTNDKGFFKECWNEACSMSDDKQNGTLRFRIKGLDGKTKVDEVKNIGCFIRS